MYKYYLFKINKLYYKEDLYNILNSIRKSSIKDIGTTFSLYKKITNSISSLEKQTIIKYLKNNGNYLKIKNNYKYYDYYTKEKTTIIFHNNYIVIKTNNIESNILNYITNNYNYYVCNFDSSCINEKKTV